MRPLIILLLYSGVNIAQTTDSALFSILALQNDTERVNQLYKRGFTLRNQDPQLAMQYSERCMAAAKDAGSPKHMAKSLNLSGILYYRKGDHATALSQHKKALEIREQIKDHHGIALSHVNLGNIYSDAGLFEKASGSYLHALNALTKLNDKKGIANCLINLGVINQKLNHTEAALENYHLAMKLGDDLYDYEIKSLCLNNIAQVYYERGDYERSIAFNYDALKIRDMMENSVDVADSYLNLSSNYLKQNNLIEAKSALDTAYTISVRYDYSEGKQAAFQIYSEYFSQLGEFEKAYNYLQKFQKNKDSLLIAEHESAYILAKADLIPSLAPHNNTLNNLWLLFSVVILFISVPIVLVRYKR